MAKSPRTGAEVQALILIILDEIAAGTSLRQACRNHDIEASNVWPLLAKEHWDAYQVATLRRAALWAEEIIDISDDQSQDMVTDDKGNSKGNMAAVARSRLQVDTRKWLLSKLIPRQYGDAVALTGADGGPLTISWSANPIVDITPDEQAQIEGPK
jgi:hypothetical protein